MHMTVEGQSTRPVLLSFRLYVGHTVDIEGVLPFLFPKSFETLARLSKRPVGRFPLLDVLVTVEHQILIKVKNRI